MDPANLFLVFLAFAAGGIIKGATGAGAPLLAVPIMAVLRDVEFAVAVFVLPNIIPNLWQYRVRRQAITSRRFAWSFALAGGLGAGLGTIALAGWRSDILLLAVGLVLAGYIVFRLINPNWSLKRDVAARLAVPMGLVAGALQGATGLSAPVSLSFMNAVRFERDEFMGQVALFFIFLGVVQLPAQIWFGIMTSDRFAYSAMALVPMFMFMPLGAWIGRRLPRVFFERAILALLAILAAKILIESFGM